MIMNRAHIEVPASAGDVFVTVLMDVDDYLRLEGRALSIGSHGYPQLWADRKVQTVHRAVHVPEIDRERLAIKRRAA